jgi:hypothetical protein
VLSVKQAAAHASVCESIVRAWVRSGSLAHYRLGVPGKRGKIAIRVEDLDAVMAGCKVCEKGPATPVAKPPKAKTAFRHLRIT